MFGIALHENGAVATIDAIRRADELGVPAAWLTSGSADQMSILAVAASQTAKIALGTAVVPTWLRHPLVLAQQADVVDALAPGRLLLGIGPSHEPMMKGKLGVDFRKPLTQTREYLQILRQCAAGGSIDFDGEFFHVHLESAPKLQCPLMMSALQPRSFELAGKIADGAISWICPAHYLREQARPAMGASGRLLAHTFVCVSEDAEAVRADARKRLELYPKLPFYRSMLAGAGDEEAANGRVSDRMIETVVIHGSEEECVQKLRRFAEDATANDVIASLMVVGDDRRAGLEAGMRVVARA